MTRFTWIVTALIALGGGGLIALFAARVPPAANAQTPPPALTDWRVIDLTQPLTPDIPIWPGDPAFEVEAWASYENDGYFINRIATKVVEVREGRLWEYAGDYDYYLEKRAEEQGTGDEGLSLIHI